VETPDKEDLILLNRLCWIGDDQSMGLDPELCAHLLALGLICRTPGGHWVPTASGRSVAVTSITDGFRDWLPAKRR
jgi:hypothetical protein